MNVALVKLSSIGDVVHALPVAAALKRHAPGARITWVAEAREATVVRGHPDVDAVVVADTRGWRRTRPGLPAMREALAVARTLRGAAFDVAIDLQGLMKSGLLTALTRAPRRIGFAPGVARERASTIFTNARVRPPAHARHVVEQYLALLAPLGIAAPRVEFRLPADLAAEALVDDFLARAGIKPADRLVVLNPGAGRPDKRWPRAHFEALAHGLASDADARVVVLWGPGEEDDARAIAAAAAGATPAPPTTLAELAALARRARLMVAGDTGPLHIAAALGTPCLALFGPTSAARNGPYGVGHRALGAADGRIASIAPAEALSAARGLLESA
ncbi:MAG TPA: lipopolysaccharide heptosyltransferase I [Terriglobales bacterium]|nr:lipopolysaccharide heptosyltransferase I [Terriglobales bacterium]